MRIHRDERGQTIILVALSLPLLLGFIGIATDVGALFKDKRTMQTAADAAAIAGALSLNSGNTAITAAGKKASAANGYTDSSNGVIVNVVNGPTWQFSNYKGVTGYVEATVTKPESTIFLSIFGYPSVNVSARAVAANGPSTTCGFILGTASSGGGSTFNVFTGASLQSASPQCGLIVDSSTSPPITVAAGSTLNMKSIGTVGDCGGGGGCGGGTIIPTPVAGVIPYSDPLGYLPQFTCNGASCTNGTDTYPCISNPDLTRPLQPGCYNGITAVGNFAINLQPGTYVFNGDLSLGGTGGSLSGTNVTIFMASGTITFANNSATLNLSAPTSGTYNGVLFAQSSTDPNTAVINGTAGSTLQGFFYFPDSTVLLGSSFTNIYTGFVVQSLIVGGTVSFNSYNSLPGTTSPITAATLVE